ncbi:hypothetical protein AAHA92_31960 [Salvia divinorum]
MSFIRRVSEDEMEKMASEVMDEMLDGNEEGEADVEEMDRLASEALAIIQEDAEVVEMDKIASEALAVIMREAKVSPFLKAEAEAKATAPSDLDISHWTPPEGYVVDIDKIRRKNFGLRVSEEEMEKMALEVMDKMQKMALEVMDEMLDDIEEEGEAEFEEMDMC